MDIRGINLGVLGQPVAGHLLAAGHKLHLKNHLKDRSRPVVEQCGIALDSTRAVDEAAKVVIFMVPNTPDVEAVLFGPDGVAEGLSLDDTVIGMSSISPVATRDFAAGIAEAGNAFADAPVSGGEAGARAASLTIMAGRKQEDFDGVLPIFEAMGRNINLMGEVGPGQTTMIVNQIILALNIGPVAEGQILASWAGADPAKVLGALTGGLTCSSRNCMAPA